MIKDWTGEPVEDDLPEPRHSETCASKSDFAWDYRVIEHDADLSAVGRYAIHTVFYDESNSIVSYNLAPECCADETIDGLKLQAEMITSACDQEILLQSELDEISRKHRPSKRTKRSQTSLI